jgi:N-acetylmuramoyl-L-alanine amidase
MAGRRLRPIAAGALLALSCAVGRVAGAEAPLVLLDPGHNPSHPGAIGVRGTEELQYNDAFVALLEPKLVRAGFRVELTRRPGQELDLEGRAARASELGAWLLLSIHHDSAQEQFLERMERDGKEAYRATRPIRGFSLFVSGRNARYLSSLRAAEALGRRLLALGRPPTLHHAEPIPGEGRPLLDRRLGIYRFDELKVLRMAACPAVLLEVGVLVDEVDEAYVSDPARREAIADAVVQALLDVRDR